MKTVVQSAMVAHLWANRSQDTARNSSNTFYFTGPVLYSYGSHFVVGAWLDCGADGLRVLWNTAGYSISTSRHQSHASRALRGFDWQRKICVDGLKGDDVTSRARVLHLAEAMMTQARERFESARTTQRRSAKRDGLVSAAFASADNARLFAALGTRAEGDAASLDGAERARCRAILATLAKLPERSAYPEDDGAAQLEFIAGAARIIGTDAARKTMHDKNARAVRQYEEAAHISAERIGRVSYAWQCVRDSLALNDAAAGLARSYKLRAPKFPRKDAEALRAKLEPLAIAEDIAERVEWIARSVRRAERGRVNVKRGATGWYAVERDAADAIAHASRGAFVPSSGPVAALLERAEALRAKARRGQLSENQESNAREAIAEARTAEDYATNGRPELGSFRDAARCYRHAIALGERARSIPGRYRENVTAETLATWGARLAECVAQFAAEDAARVDAWRNNEPGGMAPRDAGPALRLSRDGSTIETSWGASVPVSVAPGLWGSVRDVRASGKDWDVPAAFIAAGRARLGSFMLERINADGSVIVGCHNIAFSELQHIARALGYADADADAETTA